MNGATLALGLTGIALLSAPAHAVGVRLLSQPEQTCPRYGTIELQVALDGYAGNPYDPDEVALDLLVTAPSGQSLVVPGYYWEGFTRALRDGAEHLTPTGESGWRVRLCPVEEGTYALTLQATGKEGTCRAEGGTLEATASEAPGFVRRARGNDLYFAFDDGSPYFALGHNVCWPNQAGTFDYDDYFARMEEAGENYSRLWLGPGGFTAFATQHQDPPHSDLTRVDQRSAWRLDYVLELARRHGLYLMLCIESFNYLRIHDPYPAWPQNAYRAEVGGPISAPAEFFTSEEAKKHFRDRLRYLVARYGASTHNLAWEFWNEVDLCEGYASEPVAAWHREMAAYLRALDPYDHLITTSFANTAGDAAVDGIPELDYVQSHNYGAPDIAAMMALFSRSKRERYGRPHLFGEFGVGAEAEHLGADSQGWHLHEGIWASTMAGDAGCAALWWWDNYIRPQDLYHQFRALRDFVDGAPFGAAGFGPIRLPEPTLPAAAHVEPVTVELVGGQGFDAGEPLELRFPHDGAPPVAGDFPRFLHGTANHPEWHNPIRLRVDSPRPWRLAVRIEGVSGWGGAALRVAVDGEERLSMDLPDTTAREHATVHGFDGPVWVDVPAGPHELLVENPGRDWLTFGLVFENYATGPALSLRLHAIGGPSCAYLWARHGQASWRDLLILKREPQTVEGASVLVPGLRPGRYVVEWYDTWRGAWTERRTVEATEAGAAIPLPPVTIDAAVRVTREETAP